MVETATKSRSVQPPRRAVTVLLVVATVLAFVAIFSYWVNRQALNTDDWTNTSSRLLQDKRVQGAVADYLIDQLYANIDVAAELKKALPKDVRSLAGPAAGGLREFGGQAARQALATSQVQDLWRNANRAAHEQLLKVIDGGSNTVSTQGGKVTLDLRRLVEQVGTRIGVGADLAGKLPPSAGRLVILHSHQLDLAQKIARLIRRVTVILIVLVVGLYALAVQLARGRRREALRGVGIGLACAGAAALVARALAGDAVVNALTSTASALPAAHAVWSIGTSLLTDFASSSIVIGLLVVAAAWLAGPMRPAVALRRELAPYLNERRDIAYGAVGAIFLLAIVWAPIGLFRQPIPLLLIAGLLVAGTEALRRQTLRELPDAHLGDVSDYTKQRLRRLGRELLERTSDARGAMLRARSAIGTDGGAGGTGTDARLERLERLAALRQRGVLTNEEFEAEKAEILGLGEGAGSRPQA